MRHSKPAIRNAVLAAALAALGPAGGGAQPVIDAGAIKKGLLLPSAREPGAGRASVDIWVDFGHNSAELSGRGLRQASEMADAMQDPELEGRRFLLVGHTDARGSAEHNFQLSLRRANAVRAALAGRFGVRRGRIDVEGRGEEEPLSEGDAESDHALNRRVELLLAR